MPIVNVHRIESAPPLILTNYYLTFAVYDAVSQGFNIELDVGLVTAAGQYAMLRSPVPLQNYTVQATTSWVGGTPTRQVTYVTPPGYGDVVSIGGTLYYAIVVTVV
jgi:hypothetical protein